MFDYDEFLKMAIKSFKPTSDPVYNRQVINALFETEAGILDHRNVNEPMMGNKFSKAYDYLSGNILETHLRNFIAKSVNKHCGMSFDEYLNRPRYEIEQVNNICDEFSKAKTEAADAALSELNSNKNKPQK